MKEDGEFTEDEDEDDDDKVVILFGCKGQTKSSLFSMVCNRQVDSR